jgi:acetamidase/formamidase
MEIVEFTPTPDQYAFTFGGVEPVMRIKPGTILRLWTEDAFCGLLRSTADLCSEKVDPRFVNPQTGPFYVDDAEPGDTLALHMVTLEPARDWGVSAASPFSGGLTSNLTRPSLQEPLADRTWVYECDKIRRTLAFRAQIGDFNVDLPLAPMLGTVGVAPAAKEVRTTVVPDRFGGNMDAPQIKAGVTVFLAVNVEGAMFSIGDGHYRQGEGEACGTAVEGAMITTLIVDLVKDVAPLWPRLEDDDYLMTVGSTRPLDDAWRIGQMELVRWFESLYSLDSMDAYQLLSQVSKAPIANVVDTNYSVVVQAPKALLPKVESFGGMHSDLRRRAMNIAI